MSSPQRPNKPSQRTPRKPGRPTDYDPKFCESAAKLAAEGATDLEIADALNIHFATLYRWRHEHPEFREALKLGKEAADDRVEASLYHRAVGYTFGSVKIMQNNGRPVIVPFREHVPPDIGAITLWLTNRRGEQWKAKRSLEGGGEGSSPLVVEVRQLGVA